MALKDTQLGKQIIKELNKPNNIHSMIKSVELEVPCVELLQDAFEPIFRLIKNDIKIFHKFKQFIGREIKKIMACHGYSVIENSKKQTKRFPVKIDGPFTSGARYN